MDLKAMREEFTRAGLSRKDLAASPFVQFEKWFGEANGGGISMPNAMTLATVSATGQPSVRTVLLKFFDERGLVFFTNYESQKAREIAENPKVAVLFFWKELERQVKIAGQAMKVSTAESLKYFLSRPRGSQLGAWVSNQSQVISSRQLLLAKFEEMRRKFENKEVSLPAFWGGYRIVPTSFEFWQGRENRLHDRFLYQPDGAGGWVVNRLAP
ncbi:MAG: pyridoxamine 5'-phosphate oxidase [Bacteroidetes bacterium]|nr:MAG: pyridoxamine 5'-phosphate oxidase [Bacteroidota bacterium]